MPQVVAAVLIGAGIAAGVKWLAREMTRVADAGRMSQHASRDDVSQRGPLAVAPKDLGALEWDAEAGVYRPSRSRQN